MERARDASKTRAPSRNPAGLNRGDFRERARAEISRAGTSRAVGREFGTRGRYEGEWCDAIGGARPLNGTRLRAEGGKKFSGDWVWMAGASEFGELVFFGF